MMVGKACFMVKRRKGNSLLERAINEYLDANHGGATAILMWEDVQRGGHPLIRACAWAIAAQERAMQGGSDETSSR